MLVRMAYVSRRHRVKLLHSLLRQPRRRRHQLARTYIAAAILIAPLAKIILRPTGSTRPYVIILEQQLHIAARHFRRAIHCQHVHSQRVRLTKQAMRQSRSLAKPYSGEPTALVLPTTKASTAHIQIRHLQQTVACRAQAWVVPAYASPVRWFPVVLRR